MKHKYEVYTIVHRGLFLNIITEYDLSFTEMRTILDLLFHKGAWEGAEEMHYLDEGKSYQVNTESFSYSVEVYRYEVFIYNRKALPSPKPPEAVEI